MSASIESRAFRPNYIECRDASDQMTPSASYFSEGFFEKRKVRYEEPDAQ